MLMASDLGHFTQAKNKAKRAVTSDVIHSVDSLELVKSVVM